MFGVKHVSHSETMPFPRRYRYLILILFEQSTEYQLKKSTSPRFMSLIFTKPSGLPNSSIDN